MNSFPFTLTELLAAANVAMASIMVILAFSLLGYTFTYNFRSPVARMYAILLTVMATYSSDVALNRVLDVASTEAWLRFQWLGIAMVPAGYYLFPPCCVPAIESPHVGAPLDRVGVLLLSVVSAASALRQPTGGRRDSQPAHQLSVWTPGRTSASSSPTLTARRACATCGRR
ncbi:MAG: hypothetical protein R2838_22205 [Caldilineaceae bacterium]